MGTEHYNFTYIEDVNPIDIAGDTKVFLDQIDNALYEKGYTEYPTFQEMTSAAHVVGEICRTAGYDRVGDGGHGMYYVGGSFINGIYGERHGDYVYSSCGNGIVFSEWGVLPYNGDISSRVNAIIGRCSSEYRDGSYMRSLSFHFADGRYQVADTIGKFPAGSVIKGTNMSTPYQRFSPNDSTEVTEADFSGGTTLVCTIKENGKTCMTTSSRCRIEGIFFVSIGTYIHRNISTTPGVEGSPGFTWHPSSTMYEALEEQVLYDVNGLDMSKQMDNSQASNCSVVNCSFNGFGGYGMNPSHHALIRGCAFYHCHVGMIGSDAEMIDNCYFGNGGYGIVTRNVRLSNCWFDAMAHHAIYAGESLISGSHAQSSYREVPQSLIGEISGCVFDHIQYSAIKARSCGYNGLTINGSFSRCGFYRAGMSVADACDELSRLSTKADVEWAIDGMCAINIPIANRLQVKGNVASIDFVDGNYDGSFNCPQFAISAEEFCNGKLEFTPYNAHISAVYEMDSNYWWTKTGFADTKMPNISLRYKFGIIDTGKTRHLSNIYEGKVEDTVLGLTMNIVNNVFSFLKTSVTKAAGSYTLDAIPGYITPINGVTLCNLIPVFSTSKGYVGYIKFPDGPASRNPHPVLVLTTGLSGDTIYCEHSFADYDLYPKA